MIRKPKRITEEDLTPEESVMYEEWYVNKMRDISRNTHFSNEPFVFEKLTERYDADQFYSEVIVAKRRQEKLNNLGI
jgi:hypothetical protein